MFSSEFFITSLIVVLIPGTGVIYTVSTGLFLGGMWREIGGIEFNSPSRKKGIWQIIQRGFLINILSPKLAMTDQY